MFLFSLFFVSRFFGLFFDPLFSSELSPFLLFSFCPPPNPPPPPPLQKKKKQLCFNDDIQGTGAVVCSGFLNGVRAQGTPASEARVVFYGAGSSAVGVAETIAAAVADDAGGRITIEQARAAIFMVDSKGLITTTRGDALPQHKVAFARGDGTPDMTDLVEIVRHVRPHALVGLSGQGGAFTEPVLRELARHQERPLVFPLSNPTSCAEVTAGER